MVDPNTAMLVYEALATGEGTQGRPASGISVGLRLEWWKRIEIHFKLCSEVGVAGDFKPNINTSSHTWGSFTCRE